MVDTIELSHYHEVSFNEIVDVARGKKVHVPEATYTLLDSRRAQVVEYIASTGQPAYGFNRGFGSNVHLMVSGAENLRALQENLIRSHACCLGEPAPIEVVRATMFLRARSLALGQSGVRSVIVRQLAEALNRGFTPLTCLPSDLCRQVETWLLCPTLRLPCFLARARPIFAPRRTQRRLSVRERR